MSRKWLISLHLYMAAFFTPVILLITVSGGLYLFGIKGNVKKEVIYHNTPETFNIKSKDIEKEIRTLIATHNIEHDFEYVKGGGNTYFTRPTSKPYLVFKMQKEKLQITRQTPDFIRSLIELHKGHGSKIFKNYQKLTAFGLVFILISGFFLGLTSPSLRNKTLVISGASTFILLMLILI